MTHEEMVESIACQVCGKAPKLPPDECHHTTGRKRPLCNEHSECRILEKSEEQLIYTLSSTELNSFLRACPGCGKTEVVGLKAAYEIQKWNKNPGGIAVLTFTNNATEVIRQRVSQFAGIIEEGSYPHFIGTIDSWLHGYIAHPFGHVRTQYEGKNGDYSIRVIDASSSASFLNAFKTKYSVGQTGNVFANQFFFDVEASKFVFDSGNPALDNPRRSASLASWLVNDLAETKRRFLMGGFATYQDIEYLCHCLLAENDELAKKLSRRFPLIIVDECQDLSWIQLSILNRLKEQGTVLHFVGDLNQAIFEFKEVDPQKVEDFVADGGFTELRLTSNYRSCQPIVDLCQGIVKGPHVVGKRATSLDMPCIWISYKDKDMSSLPIWFEDYLKELRISIEKSVIVTRSWKNVSRLRPSRHGDINSHQKRLAMAIHLWKTRNTQSMEDSLRYLGRFFADKYFANCSSAYRHHCCPECVSSSMRWRIFLSRVLSECLKNKSIADLSQAWTAWVVSVRKHFGALARACLPYLEDTLVVPIKPFDDLDGVSFRAPPKIGHEQVEKTLLPCSIQTPSIQITTIHSVKGQTYDAVLVVSAPSQQGTSDGYWTQWLEDPHTEAARLAYVASSRPQQLLIWAVPTPTAAQWQQIESMGFAALEGP